MPVTALLLVLLSGLLHATWNLAAKRAAAGADFVIEDVSQLMPVIHEIARRIAAA